MKRVLIILLALASVIPAGAKNRSIYHKNSSMEKRRLSTMDMNEKGKVVASSFEDRARSEAYAAWLSGMNGIISMNALMNCSIRSVIPIFLRNLTSNRAKHSA